MSLHFSKFSAFLKVHLNFEKFIAFEIILRLYTVNTTRKNY